MNTTALLRAREDFDGRAQTIANPDLVERLARGEPLAAADPSTIYGGGAKGYTDYPALERVEA